MRKVYIDCGAHKGNTIKKFVLSKYYSSDFEIFAFEPNPHSKVHKRYGKNETVYQKAVWIRNGEIPFYITKEKRGSQAGTLIKEKSSGRLDKKHPTMVSSIDFGGWIKETFSPNDYIIVKMDIEGAEYWVIDSMIKDGSIVYVNLLWLETHEDRIAGMSADDRVALTKRLDAISSLEKDIEWP